MKSTTYLWPEWVPPRHSGEYTGAAFVGYDNGPEANGAADLMSTAEDTSVNAKGAASGDRLRGLVVLTNRSSGRPLLPAALNFAPIIIGSHIDSVPEGGNYDGNVGSLGAIEVAQTLHEHGVSLRHPLQVIIFSNEEGVMLGSSAVGRKAETTRLDSVSQSGKVVREGVRFLGGDPDRIAEVGRQPGSMAAYLELHIEQGGVLESEKLQIGIVEGIVGILNSEVTVSSVANHAGTTPMSLRHDALLAAGRFIDRFNQLITNEPGSQVGTLGWIKAEPGAFNVVPGKVTLGLEIRDLDADKIERLFEKSRQVADEVGRLNGTAFHFSPRDLSLLALTDPGLRESIGASAKRLGFSSRLTPRGAGHDAQEMANLGPIGMIFIPGVGGISHSPREFLLPGDIENGANVLLGTVVELSRSSGSRSR